MQQDDLKQQAVQNAFQTGLKMLKSETITTPNAWNKDLSQLETLVIGLLSGQLMIIDGPNARLPDDKKVDDKPPPGGEGKSANGEGKEKTS